MKLKNKVLRFFKDIKYSDIEPILLWGGIILYLAIEYFKGVFPFLGRIHMTPFLIVAVIKLTLTKIDNLSINKDANVGYLKNVIDDAMGSSIKCEKIRIFSYDSKGFYHSISGKDFYAKEIIVLMHEKVRNEETEKRWNSLVKKKKADKVTVLYHNYKRFIYGMSFDNRIGVFGTFKPECIVNQEDIASTFNTYSCKSKSGEIAFQMILDYNAIFDAIYNDLNSKGENKDNG